MPIAPDAEPFHADATPRSEDGQRIGVLLSHGFTGSPKSMRPWAEHLAGLGYAVSVPRLPGHGTSWQELNKCRWADWYGEIQRSFDKLAANCDQVVVGGLSMGGALVLQLAADRGRDVAGVVVVNPGLTNANPARHVRHLVKFVTPSIGAIRNDIKKPGQDEGAYDRTPTRAAASLIDAWKGVIADLPKVTQPLLMFRSAEDHVVPPSSGRIIMTTVSSRDVTERILEHSYHVATLDNDASLIQEESAEFIRRVTGP